MTSCFLLTVSYRTYCVYSLLNGILSFDPKSSLNKWHTSLLNGHPGVIVAAAVTAVLQDIEVDDEGVVGVVLVGLDDARDGAARVSHAFVELAPDDGVAVGGVLQDGAEDRLRVALDGPEEGHEDVWLGMWNKTNAVS